MAVTEDAILGLVAEVPARRRLQARAAVTGSADDLISRVQEIRSVPFGDWSASLSAAYILDFAARYRSPAQVAAIGDRFRGEPGEDVVLDAASVRPPAEIAAIMRELSRLDDELAATQGAKAESLAKSLLNRVIIRRLPADQAELLDVLPNDNGLVHAACAALLESASPDTIARVALHLRGRAAAEALEELLTSATTSISSAALAELLASASRLGDTSSVQGMVAAAAAWQVPSAEHKPAIPDVDRIARLVQILLERGHAHLARQVVDRTLAGYARSGERYRLYALVFVFKQRALDTEAGRVMKEISAGASVRDVTEMIIKFCQAERPDDTATLLRAILEKPEPGITADAAVEFARRLNQAHEEIFATVSTWRCQNLSEFERRLAGTSNDWAQKFRDFVASAASDRRDGADIADLVDWLRTDTDTRRGNRRAVSLLAETVRRGDASRLIALIHRLRETGSWWVLRAEGRRYISEHCDAATMAGLVQAASECRCLPAALWLAQDWLTRYARADDDVVPVVESLHNARGNPGELHAALMWSGHSFRPRPDGTDPVRKMEAAGLMVEAMAWQEGKRKQWRVRQPDPDPPL